MATKKEDRSVFETLNAINVNGKTERKNGLTYLSWAWAWAEVKKAYPEATYRIYENPDGWNYFTDGKTCWVKTSVTIAGIENIEYLPVMDYRNASIPKEKVTSYDVNKAIQRSLTKCCARHGLGLYIYAGEDLPECDQQAAVTGAPQPQSKAITQPESNATIQQVLQEIAAATSTGALKAIWNSYPQMQKNAQFTGAMTARKDQILNNGKS